MRWSIRNQVLIPVAAVQVAAVAVLALVAATAAARRAESRAVERLDAVIATLGRSSFPLTPDVLEAMRGLSGGHFVACSRDGAILASTLPGLARLPEAFRSLTPRANVVPPGRSPSLELGGAHYFAASIKGTAGRARPTLLVLYPEDAWRRARWEAAMPPVAVGVGALAAMVGVTGMVAHRLGRRLRSLEEKAAAIADGDLRPVEAGSGGDEVRDLTLAINRMCSRLNAMQDAIRRAERAGVLAQLAAGLAHQLRNAATGARMAMQLHARRCPTGAEDGSLGVALRQLALGEAQVKALLALGTPRRTVLGPVSADQIIEEVASLVEPACRHARVGLSHRGGPESIVADVESLRAAVLNLALNAVEAAGSGGEVSLSASSGASGVVFEVVDTGPGPPPELAETLFEPFVTGKPEGVGLGLAVARQAATDHGGTLRWSRVEGRTRFALEIPSRDPREEGAP